MFLSCYDLALKYPEVRKAINDSYEMHRSVMSAFPNVDSTQPREEMSILYRLVPTKGSYKLYVTSREIPIKSMPEGFFPVPGSPKNITAVVQSFKAGNVYSFNLMAMPAKKVKNPNGKNSKRVFLSNQTERSDWLHSRAIQNGFKVVSFYEQENEDYRLKKGLFRSIIFKGSLVVLDEDKFCSAYINGIGAEKAFGCGMLMVSLQSREE